MGHSTLHRVSRLVGVACAIAVLGLALVAPTLMMHHPGGSFARTHELKFRNAPCALNDFDAKKRINQDAQLLSRVEVIIEIEAPAGTILAQKSDANLAVEPQLIPHKKIASSPKGDPDLA